MNIWLPTIATGTGAEVYTKMLAEGLAKRGHTVQLDLAPHHYQYAPWLAGLKPPSGCDIVIANSWSARAFAGPAPLLTIIHHVVHDPAYSGSKTIAQRAFHHLYIKPMERAAIRASAQVVAVSETTKAAIADHLSPIDAKVVLNGIDTQFFCPATPEGVPAPGADKAQNSDDVLKLLFVGKPSRRKGFDLVQQIVAGLGKQCRFTCIGGKAEPGLQLPPGDYRGRVTREELRESYRRADFLLLPSRVEGFGYAAAEAMACGTPVICTPNGAVAEICSPPDAAIAIQQNNTDAAITAMLQIGKNQKRHAEMRSVARKIATERLSSRRWVDEVEQVLEQIIAENPMKSRCQSTSG